MANIVFNSVDLSLLSNFETGGVRGTHDLNGMEYVGVPIPGREVVDDVPVRRTTRPFSFDCLVREETHAELVTGLRAIKRALSPRFGYKYFTVTDKPGMQILARSRGFPLDIDRIPYDISAARFSLEFDHHPYWEDVSATTTTISGLSGSIDNEGDVETYPVYVCLVLGSLPSGLSFTVGSKTFTYTGALALSDELTVTTYLPDVTREDGSKKISLTSLTSDFPELLPGANAITKSSINFDLQVTYRKRYE